MFYPGQQLRSILVLLVINFSITTKSNHANSKEYQIWKVNSPAQTTANQIISMRCVSTQIDIIYFNANDLKFPKMCSYRRTYSQRLSYSLLLKNSRKPEPIVVRKLYVNETRTKGTLNVVSIGFIESGVKQLVGTAFLEVMNYPNLKRGSCSYAEGITRQVGTAQLILSQYEPDSLPKMFFSYNHAQLVALFKKQSKAECYANSRLRYRTSIQNENIVHSSVDGLNRGFKETTESFVENLAECEPFLSEPVLRITDKQEIKIRDSCDSVNLSDRYQSGITRFVVYTTQNNYNVLSVRIIYKNANRNKGTFYETIIGIVIKGPPNLLGTAYLRLSASPNLSQNLCQSEPGLTKLVGSSERIFSNLNVQNLISVMSIESLISKIRVNRIIDCLGFITVHYDPGLVFSDVIENEHAYISNLTQSFKIDN